MRLYLIRHGQASFGSEDYDQLSGKGIEQSRQLGRHFNALGVVPDVVIRGSMHRHKQTAEQCLGELAQLSASLPVIEDAAWNEYDHSEILATYKKEFSSSQAIREYLADKPQPQLLFKQLFAEAVTQWVNAESDELYTQSWADFQNRVLNALEGVVDQYLGKTVFVYTSGGPISLIASRLLALPAENFLQINWTLLNAGVTKLIQTRDGLLLSSLNGHDAFEGAAHKSLLTYV